MKKNTEIAEIFKQIADLLELRGELPFKVSAYRKAAKIIEDLNQNIEEIYSGASFPKIPGIGEGLSKKIVEFLKTGTVTKLEEEKKLVPQGLVELLSIPGLGPKTIKLASDKLGVKNIEDLIRTIENGTLAQLFGMGKKKVENIMRGIQLKKQFEKRLPLSEAITLCEDVINYMKKTEGLKNISPAGSLRRMKETVGDIDIIATAQNGEKVVSYFCNYPGVTNILASGKTKGSVLVSMSGTSRQIDLRIVKPSEFGSALQYFTGSKQHNIKLRTIAKQKGLKISEYGVFDGGKKIAGKNEIDVYRVIGLPWIPPELREDRGEIEAAATGGLPSLIERKDIKGDLHIHSNYSDGGDSIESIARQAIKLGYEYIAICDHSVSAKYARGLEPERLYKQWEEINKIQKKFPSLKILKGAEVDILSDGKLDYPDGILEKLDIVIAAIHQGFKKNVTERLISAIKHPLVHIIAHPTGRLLSQREGYEVDLDPVLKEAAENGKVLELNAYHDRLDLGDSNLLKARHLGIKIAIGTDSHNIAGLEQMKFGVAIARRGWLEEKDVINCWGTEKLLNFLKH